MHRRQLAFFLTVMSMISGLAFGQHLESDTGFDARRVFSEFDSQAATGQVHLRPAWWANHVRESFGQAEPLPTDLNTLLFLALRYSNRIEIAKLDPLVRETAIDRSRSVFDWTLYANGSWTDSNEPIGNTLTAGGTTRRFRNQIAQSQSGLRQTNELGGILDLSQRFGWQDNNSIFLDPRRQATSRLVLSYSHPLLRGNGRYYNESLIVLSKLDAATAHEQFLAALQDELLEITSSYWNLYLQRALLAQQMRLYLRTRGILHRIEARRDVDHQTTQHSATRSALASRKAGLIRSRTAVSNAETRLRGLVNAPELSAPGTAELLPLDEPSLYLVPCEPVNFTALALQNRPEIAAATYQRDVAIRQLAVAKNELQPNLNLNAEAYGPGLRGESQFGQAYVDQFGGRPSYSIGLQYEFSPGNRRARARVCEREHEFARVQAQYRQALQTVRTEVDVATREVYTTYREIVAKSDALRASEAEVETLTERWLRTIDGPGTASLNLDALLRAQERVTAAESEYVQSIVQYNLALIRMKRSAGILLKAEDISVRKVPGPDCDEIQLIRGTLDRQPADAHDQPPGRASLTCPNHAGR